MKPTLALLCAFFILMTLASCKREPYADEFGSYNAWLKFKAESQNSYDYSVATGSITGLAQKQ